MNKLFCRRHGRWKKGLSIKEHEGNGGEHMLVSNANFTIELKDPF
jgi:hypothetical protein